MKNGNNFLIYNFLMLFNIVNILPLMECNEWDFVI